MYACTIQIRGYAHYFHELSSLENTQEFFMRLFLSKIGGCLLRISNKSLLLSRFPGDDFKKHFSKIFNLDSLRINKKLRMKKCS